MTPSLVGLSELADRYPHTLAEGGITPEVKGEEGEKRFAVVGLLGQVLVEKGRDALRIEESPRLQEARADFVANIW